MVSIRRGEESGLRMGPGKGSEGLQISTLVSPLHPTMNLFLKSTLNKVKKTTMNDRWLAMFGYHS